MRQLELLRGYRFRGERIDRSRNDNDTNDGGNSWSQGPLTDDVQVAAYCLPDSQDCWTASYGGLGSETVLNATPEINRTTDDGADWETSALPDGSPTTQLSEIYCTDALDCWAIGSELWRSTDGGASWVVAGSTSPSGDEITCVSSSTCIVVGSAFYETQDGGQSWVESQFPTNFEALGPLYCWGPSVCDVGGSENSEAVLLRTADAGSEWSTDLETEVPNFDANFDDLSCLTSSTCILVGGTFGVSSVSSANDLEYLSVDSGVTWFPITLPSMGSSYVFDAVDCPTATNCLATGLDEVTLRSHIIGGASLISFGLSSGGVASSTLLGTTMTGSAARMASTRSSRRSMACHP